MHKHVKFYLEHSIKTIILISIISNLLDHIIIKMVLSLTYNSTTLNNKDDFIIPRSNWVRLNETTLNNRLTVCE